MPLTVGEFIEWGNPKIAEQYAWMRAYSPYDNLKRGAYPAMLVAHRPQRHPGRLLGAGQVRRQAAHAEDRRPAAAAQDQPRGRPRRRLGPLRLAARDRRGRRLPAGRARPGRVSLDSKACAGPCCAGSSRRWSRPASRSRRRSSSPATGLVARALALSAVSADAGACRAGLAAVVLARTPLAGDQRDGGVAVRDGGDGLRLECAGASASRPAHRDLQHQGSAAARADRRHRADRARDRRPPARHRRHAGRERHSSLARLRPERAAVRARARLRPARVRRRQPLAAARSAPSSRSRQASSRCRMRAAASTRTAPPSRSSRSTSSRRAWA